VNVPSSRARSLGDDPLPAFNYSVRITGVAVVGFSEVTGLQVEVEWFDYREGGVNGFVHRLAGPARYPSNLVLRRGMTKDLELWRWVESSLAGRIVRRNVSVLLNDAAGAEVRKWIFHGAYPVRWSGPDLRAESGALAIESLELAHRGLSPTGSGLVA
jgi:phage tail-like protein